MPKLNEKKKVANGRVKVGVKEEEKRRRGK